MRSTRRPLHNLVIKIIKAHAVHWDDARCRSDPSPVTAAILFCISACVLPVVFAVRLFCTHGWRHQPGTRSFFMPGKTPLSVCVCVCSSRQSLWQKVCRAREKTLNSFFLPLASSVPQNAVQDFSSLWGWARAAGGLLYFNHTAIFTSLAFRCCSGPSAQLFYNCKLYWPRSW